MNKHKNINVSWPDSNQHNSWFTESLLFLLIVLIEAGIFLYLINTRCLVGGHDGFEYFQLQYYFLNSVVSSGEIPQWMPFVTQGTVVNWWHIMQGGILQNVLLQTGSLLKDVNFLSIFYAGLFVDQMILLVGTWLLGRCFFVSPLTVFFVSLSIMGSCIWLLQPWWNFHLYYAIPLILYFLHRLLDCGQWRYFLLAGTLLLVQSLGGLPYFLPVITMIIFVYLVSYGLVNYRAVREKIKSLPFNGAFILTMVTLLLMFAALYGFMNFGTEQLVNYTFRRQDGTAPLEVFLSYGGQLTWQAWLEMLLGFSPCLDYTLYAGILCPFLVFLGLAANPGRKKYHLLATVTILILFASSSFVSALFYYSWPLMKYFRHLILITPVIKLFLCFLAGFGFEALLLRSAPGNIFVPGGKALLAVLLFILGVLLCFLVADDQAAYAFFGYLLEHLAESLTLFITIIVNENWQALLLLRTAVVALAAAVVLLALFFIRPQKYTIMAVMLLLVLHAIDMYSFKLSEIRLKTVSLNDDHYQMLEFQPVPYPERRNLAWDQDNPRVRLLETLPIHYGVVYWTVNAFLLTDQLGHSFKTDFWLRPLDKYMKAYWNQPIHDLAVPPKGQRHKSAQVESAGLVFPQDHPAALKISGVTEDKIQFFSRAEVINSEEKIAERITRREYRGNQIFLSPLDQKASSAPTTGPGYFKEESDVSTRFHLPYQVRRFDANHLIVTTHIKNQETAWLLYSDVWHPFWKATVNGDPVPVYRANLAYKAVQLKKGFNKIHFSFQSGLVSVFHRLMGGISLLWLLIIAVLVIGMVRPKFRIDHPSAKRQQPTESGLSSRKRSLEG